MHKMFRPHRAGHHVLIHQVGLHGDSCDGVQVSPVHGRASGLPRLHGPSGGTGGQGGLGVHRVPAGPGRHLRGGRHSGGHLATSSSLTSFPQSIGEELVMLEKGSVEACQAFIKKHSQNLHPNHYYLQVRR